MVYNGIALPGALLSVSDKTEHSKKVLTRLKNEGLITDRQLTEKHQNKKYKVTYKAITRKDVQWLIDNCTSTYPWLSYLPNPFPKFSLTQISSSEQLIR